MLSESSITAPYSAPKAVTLMGAVYEGCELVGIVELKLGKVKNGVGKVSGSVVGIDGKKYAIKAVKLTEITGGLEAEPMSVSLDVRGVGKMEITIGGKQFAGTLDGVYHVQSANVGGAWAGGSAVASVEVGDLSVFPGSVLTDFLPTNEVASVVGGKWSFKKAASVKWAKPKGAALPKIYNAASGKGLVVDTSGGKTNLSGLKLTYTPKKGTFKGSFNVYTIEGEGSTAKLKKRKINVGGIVVDGVGHGMATGKNPSVVWPVTVR